MGLQRGLRLRSRESEARELPLAGIIAAGKPIEAIDREETFTVPNSLASGRGDYVLLVRGESMTGEGILDGDYVVVEGRQQAREGDLVVALVDAAEVTLKRLGRDGKRILLIAANPQVATLDLDPERVRVQGVVVAQLRSYC